MASFSDISIRFSANLKEFSTQINNAQRDMKKFGRQLKRTGAQLTVGLTAPITALGYASVAAFDVQAKALADVEAALISTGGVANRTFEQLQRDASALQETTIFGDEEILTGVTAKLLTFTNIANTEFDRTQQLALDLATRMDGDLKGATIQLGKALNDPIKQLSSLSRIGITFNEEQLKTIQTLARTGKMAQAQAMILDELEVKFGGAAAAAAKAGTGPFKQLSNQIGDLTEDFGKIISEALIPIVNRIKNVVTNLQRLDDGTKKTIVVVAALAAAIGPLLVTIGLMATTVIPGLISAFVALKAAFVSFTAVIAANPLGALAVAIGLVVGAIVSLNKNTKEVVKQQSTLSKVTDEATRSIASERAKLDELLFIARDELLSKEQRVKAVQELNKLSPKYLGNLTLEKINTDEARKSIEKYNEALLQSAKVKAAQERLQQIQSKIIEVELSASKSRREALNDEALQRKFADEAARRGITTAQVEKEWQDALNLGSAVRVRNLKAEADELLDIIKNNKDYAGALTDVQKALGEIGKVKTVSAFADGGEGTVGLGAQNEALRNHIEVLKAVQREYSKTSDEYKWLAEQIAFHTETIENAINGVTFDPLMEIITKSMLQAQESIRKTRDVMEEFEDSVNRAIENSIVAFGDAFGTMISQVVAGANVGKSVSNMLFGTLGDMLITLGKIALETAAGLVAIELALESFNPYIVAAAGVALIALGRSVKNQVKATAFADGGLVYGPTLGLVGEYAGARNNPEVIAPLNKLKELLEPGAGAVIIGGELTADGNKLRVLLNRTDARNSRFGG